MAYQLPLIDPFEYHVVNSAVRDFFCDKGFIEVPVQPRRSILAACEDPETVVDYHFNGEVWPLPQTGQMWLEYEILTRPNVPGYFCQTTSYRCEPNPVPGRHDMIFPLFEFETKGDMTNLVTLESDLLKYLGYTPAFTHKNYLDVCEEYGVAELEHEHEMRLYEECGPVVFLKNFPRSSHPFWNMRMDDNVSNKVDVILSGMETFGSAERSTDPEKMRELFHTISDGGYANLVFSKFGKDRTEKELDDYLSLDFFERCGGGIGITRLIKSLKKENLM